MFAANLNAPIIVKESWEFDCLPTKKPFFKKGPKAQLFLKSLL
jgi:hypothetical protein